MWEQEQHSTRSQNNNKLEATSQNKKLFKMIDLLQIE